MAKLEALGFDWSAPNSRGTNEAGWVAMVVKLADFKAEHGHCRVPQKADLKLGGWVEKQRAAKKRLDAGDSGPWITAERVAKLEAIGFDWVVSKRKR